MLPENNDLQGAQPAQPALPVTVPPGTQAGTVRIEFPKNFWKHVQKGGPDECWPWTGARNQYGYGMILCKVGPKKWAPRGAHRVLDAHVNGPVPADIDVMHTCDNPPCCNPGHLKRGTPQDNLADMYAKGRDVHTKRGHVMRKLAVRRQTLFDQFK